jgi:hypothetical protein
MGSIFCHDGCRILLLSISGIALASHGSSSAQPDERNLRACVGVRAR